jgi:hypothetical protein
MHFSNQTFFDDVINHRFTSGDTYDTCHKGFSPLAFPPPHAHEEITAAENEALEFYEEATVKTVGDVRKHQTKGPPPIPTNDAELIRLNTCDVAILTAFFTPWSSLVLIQEEELNDGLQQQQMDLFSRPDSTREMIPQFLWAKIRARRKFFQQMCTKAMLDVEAGATAKFAKAQLSGHTMLFLLGTKVSIISVPQQWLRNADTPGPAKKAKHDDSSPHPQHPPNGPPCTDGRYNPTEREGPWKPGAKAAGQNPSGPRVFATSREINDLLRKFPNMPLKVVATAAGFRTLTDVPTDGLPDRICLKWICFGDCSFSACRNAHPTSIDDTAAANLYRALLPGIKKVVYNMQELPPNPYQRN